MDGWTDGRTDGRMDGRMDGRTDGQTEQVAQGQYVVSDTHCPAMYVGD